MKTFAALLVVFALAELASADRTFLTAINVKIGSDGTDDEVSIKICGREKGACCTTEVLNSGWTNDFSKNDNEKWTGDWLGDCATTDFAGQQFLDLSVIKKGSDSLYIEEINLDAEEGAGFHCGRVIVDDTVEDVEPKVICRSTAW